ncbi:MAG: sugar kinase [Bacteroidota bacterium]|nr:sugar kinase [Bacteroidota bacterium]
MIVTFGEILLRLSTANSQLISQSKSFDALYGGAEANVACALARWGHQAAFITAIPDNELGFTAMQTLLANNVDTQFIQKTNHRIGMYFLETGVGLRASKVIYDRNNTAFSNITKGQFNWHDIFKYKKWFHFSGISAAISQSTADALLEAVEIASKQGLTISTDINYRSKLWKYGKQPKEVLPELLKYCDIIMGGIDAPEKVFGIVPAGKNTTNIELSDADIQSIFGQLHDLFPKASLFATTLRKVINNNHHTLQGVIYNNKQLFKSKTIDIPQILDRVGGGDAFMAGLIYGSINFDNNLEKIVNFATSSSVLKHYTFGDVCLSTLEEIEEFSKGSIVIKR